MNERASILRDAIETYGVEAQINMMIEEASELIKALCKLLRGGAVADVIEEMADCQIMLDQMIMIFGSIQEAEAAKLTRLEERIRKSHEGNELQ